MAERSDLKAMLSGLNPVLHDSLYVFGTLGTRQWSELEKWQPLATFSEAEGWSVVVRKTIADAEGLEYHGCFRLLTLQVHSSLTAVGLTAAVAGALAESSISANVVAAYHHDHLLVTAADAEEALKVLRQLSKQYR